MPRIQRLILSSLPSRGFGALVAETGGQIGLVYFPDLARQSLSGA